MFFSAASISIISKSFVNERSPNWWRDAEWQACYCLPLSVIDGKFMFMVITENASKLSLSPCTYSYFHLRTFCWWLDCVVISEFSNSKCFQCAKILTVIFLKHFEKLVATKKKMKIKAGSLKKDLRLIKVDSNPFT